VKQALARIRGRFTAYIDTIRGGRIADAAGLAASLTSEAAHIAQSTTYAYLRARTGFMAPRLFTEQPFLDGLEVTRWEAFGAVLSDLFVIAEGELRPHAGVYADRLSTALVAWYRIELMRHPPPAHREGGWNGLSEELDLRLKEAQARSSESCDSVASRAGRHIFEFLPLHPDMRRMDEEMVVNSVRFRVLAAWQALKRRADFAGIAADLCNGEHGGQDR
jgi:hypothetical protein